MLYNKMSIAKVFEFGCGNYSTAFFIERGSDVTAIEMQDVNWFNTIKQKFADHRSLTLQCRIGPWDAITQLKKEQDKSYDLVFVDGHGASRHGAINTAFDKTNVIVAHDTEEPGYHWELVEMPDTWTKFSTTNEGAQTTLYITKELAQALDITSI